MTTITEIKQNNKDRERVDIYFDDGTLLSLHKETAYLYRLKEHMQISADALTEIISESEKKGAFLKGLKIVSRGMCSEKTLKGKLAKMGFSQASADYAAEKLKGYGYIDDAAYAKAYINTVGKTSGRRKIAFELKNKGIETGCLTLSDSEREAGACTAAAEKFARAKKGVKDLRLKVYRHLLYKGFDYPLAASESAKYGGGEDDDSQDS